MRRSNKDNFYVAPWDSGRWHCSHHFKVGGWTLDCVGDGVTWQEAYAAAKKIEKQYFDTHPDAK